MGMTVEEDIAFVEWWQVVFVIDMAVGCENHRQCTSPQDRDQHVFRQYGKFQHHLVHLRIAVAANVVNIGFSGVEHRNDFLRRVIPGKVIAGSVIQDIA